MERGRTMPRGRGGRGRGRGRGRARTPVADGGNRREASKAGLANKAKELAEAGQEDASGEEDDWVQVPVVRRQPRGAADDDDAARMMQLVEDPKEKSASADDAARMKETVEDPKKKPQRDESVAGEGHASGEVQGMRRQPRCSDDDDDAAWTKQLVEDLKEKPQRDDDARMKLPVEDSKKKPVPSAPFDAGMIEHINVGGYVMERDSYDFIQYDLGMLPPSLEPEPPETEHDEPLQLWSWDSSSFPQSAPPPK